MEDKPKTQERVSIIASGYEWTCLKCGADNTEMCLAAIVKCENCNEAFFTDDPEHAR